MFWRTGCSFTLMNNVIGARECREMSLDRQAGKCVNLNAKRRAGIETVD